MGKRRKARETAMQYLYQSAVRKDTDGAPLAEFWEEAGVTPEVQTFATKILSKAFAQREKIDELIKEYTLHWKIERIAAVDLAILRMAISEMLYIPSTPPVVVIDEAVEIAKKYSTTESGAFVNGILDKIKHEVIDEHDSGKT